MKKVLLSASLLSLLFFSSCKKDWVCRCEDQDGDFQNFDQQDQTLNEARTECKARNYDETVLGIHSSLDCNLQ